MNTEELKSIGLNEEQIAEVFKLRGKEIQQAKNDYDLLKTENESLKESLNTANEKIEKFKDVDVESIKSEVDKYKDMYEKNKNDYESKINNLKLDHLIETSLLSNDARNIKSVKGLLDMEALRESKNVNDDLLGQINSIKESDPYLFKDQKTDTKKAVSKGQVVSDNSDLTYDQMLDMHNKGMM